MIDFNSKIALVTGGSIGIGKATAAALAKLGADVAVAYRHDAEGAAGTTAEIEALGRKSIAVQANVTKDAEVRNMIETANKELGPIDILINNAGWAHRQDMADISEDDWDAVVNVNLKSAFLVTRAVLPHMMSQGWGRIVNVSSGAAHTGGVMGLHYSAAKAGLEGLTRAYAKGLVNKGITVNAVAPMLIHTGDKRDNAARVKLVPMGRQGTPDEVADAIVLCVGTEFMTGQTVHMNGGAYFGM